MAGTISFSLSQQLDKYGEVLAGGKLYFFQANTVATPQNAYQDTGLTLALPNPITLDEAGRVPQFFLADGSIKIRLTDKNGVVQVSGDNLLVIGASSGGGGGPSVDPTTIFTTGDPLWVDVTGVRTGWVRDNGRTIGSATSGATERANSDCQSLYSYYWQNFSDALCPVSGGRGLTPNADWAANKPIGTRNRRGKVAAGLDDMGNSAAGIITEGTPTVAGSGGGAEKVALVSANNGPHIHTTTEADHHHSATYNSVNLQGGASFAVNPSLAPTGGATSFDTTGAKTNLTIDSSGTGTPHNNMQPYDLGTWYRKL